MFGEKEEKEEEEKKEEEEEEDIMTSKNLTISTWQVGKKSNNLRAWPPFVGIHRQWGRGQAQMDKGCC